MTAALDFTRRPDWVVLGELDAGAVFGTRDHLIVQFPNGLRCSIMPEWEHDHDMPPFYLRSVHDMYEVAELNHDGSVNIDHDIARNVDTTAVLALCDLVAGR